MPKRAPLDTDQFRVALPPQPRDPLDSLIPTSPPPKAEEQNQIRLDKTGENTKSPEHEIAGRRNGETARKIKVRPLKRQGFDVYRDQIMALNELQIGFYRKGGTKPKMGEMLRTALDEYIAKKRRELEEL